MFKKILIANRGDIAVRIVRACQESGIEPVTVYTDADRHALHVKKASEAYNIGPDPIAGYLNAHRIVNLAVATGCDALHPGYGFLSENPELARICERRGVKFIGPGVKGKAIRNKHGWVSYKVSFPPIRNGQSKTIKVKYQLPAAGPRAPSRRACR